MSMFRLAFIASVGWLDIKWLDIQHSCNVLQQTFVILTCKEWVGRIRNKTFHSVANLMVEPEMLSMQLCDLL